MHIVYLPESWWVPFPRQERGADGGIRATRNHKNGEVYCKTLNQKKRCGILTYGAVLLHDNACPHTAAHTQALLEHFSLRLPDQPPYSPDLALTTTCLLSWRTGCNHSPSSITRSWKVSKSGWATGGRLFWHKHTKIYSPIWQVPQFWWWLCWEAA
jgi:hypothetical protein